MVAQASSFSYRSFINSTKSFIKSSISRNIRNLLRVIFLFFDLRKFSFRKYRKFLEFLVSKILENSISWNMKKEFGVSVFRNIIKAFFWESIKSIFGFSVSWDIRAAFFWENMRNVSTLELESFIFLECRKFSWEMFFHFLSLV